MSKTLTFELSDEVVAALNEVSAKSGRSFEHLALEWLMRYRARPGVASPQDRQAALARLRSHAGAAGKGQPTGADNRLIDEDLAHV